MDESSFFSDSILDFVRDEDEFEEIDHLFEQIPDEVLAAVVDSASRDDEKLSPAPPLIVNSNTRIAASCSN